MNQIPEIYKQELTSRVQKQIDCEVAKNISCLFEFTLPSIREKRALERDDEPELTTNDIKDFVKKVNSASIDSIEITDYHPKSGLYENNPTALVITKIKYNESKKNTSFRTIWVLKNSTWYSTSLNKRFL